MPRMDRHGRDSEGRREGQPGPAWREAAPRTYVVNCRDGSVAMKPPCGPIVWLKRAAK